MPWARRRVRPSKHTKSTSHGLGLEYWYFPKGSQMTLGCRLGWEPPLVSWTDVCVSPKCIRWSPSSHTRCSSSSRCLSHTCTPAKCSMWRAVTPATRPVPCEWAERWGRGRELGPRSAQNPARTWGPSPSPKQTSQASRPWVTGGGCFPRITSSHQAGAKQRGPSQLGRGIPVSFRALESDGPGF